MIEILLQAESELLLGLLDRAEILYRQVAIADPRNSIAVVGLARVALERGDEPGALVQARRALAIDGENAAAQRMVQRLEEVLAYRGIAAPSQPGAADEGRAPEAPSSEARRAPVAPPPAQPPDAPPAEAPPAEAPPFVVPPADARHGDAAPPASPEPSRSLVDRLLRRR